LLSCLHFRFVLTMKLSKYSDDACLSAVTGCLCAVECVCISNVVHDSSFLITVYCCGYCVCLSAVSKNCPFFLLTHYVCNVAKRSTWQQCIHWGPTTDWPTTDRPCILENFKWPYLGNGSSDPLHVWFYCRVVFEVGGSNGATSGWTKSKMVAGSHLGKCRMAMFLQRVTQFTSCLVLW